MLTRIGWFAVRRRRLVLALTTLFLVTAGVLGPAAFGVLQGGGFNDPDAESARAADLLEREFPGGEPNVVLLATADQGTVDSPEAAATGADLLSRLQAMGGVEEALSYWALGSPPPLRSEDARHALIVARVDGDDEAMAEFVHDAREELGGDQGPLDVRIGGQDAVFADLNEQIEGDLYRAEMIAIPLTLLLLIGVFGGLVAASLPLFVGVIAVLGTFLTLYVLGSITDVSIYSINLTTALGLGLAIDYSLFVVSRFREELGRGLSVPDAVVRTVETAGKTVTLSGLTVAVSMAALLVFPQFFLRSFAYAGIAVVVLAMVASVVALPALLAVTGRRIDSLAVFRRRAVPAGADSTGFWHRVATFVMKRPLPVATVAIAGLLFLGSPFLGVQFGNPDDRVLPEAAESRQVSEVLRSDFSGNTSEAFPVVLEGVDASAAGGYAQAVSQQAGVARVESAAGTYVSGELVAEAGAAAAGYSSEVGTWVSVVPSITLSSPEGEALVQDIRALDAPGEALVGGAAAELVDSKASIADRLPIAIAMIVLSTFVLLFLMSGSLLVPVKAMVLNVLSLTATFGAMVWIFQDGNLSGLLGFTATGFLDTSMPILMFCIAFGLSMDYEVFLLSRIKEEHDRTGDNTAAVALGLERTGRIVSAAAVLMAITFFAFGTSGVSFLKLFGIGLGIAVLMDATIIRGALVPAFMRLAGEANWWAPAPLRRFHDRFGFSEAETPVLPAGEPAEAERELTGTR